AKDVAVLLEALVAGEVQRLAEPYDGADHPSELLAGRCDDVGADDRDRDHGRAGLEREPRDTGLAAVELAVVGAGPLGVDAEELTGVEHLLGRAECALAGAGAGAVDRDLAGTVEELL